MKLAKSVGGAGAMAAVAALGTGAFGAGATMLGGGAAASLIGGAAALGREIQCERKCGALCCIFAESGIEMRKE